MLHAACACPSFLTGWLAGWLAFPPSKSINTMIFHSVQTNNVFSEASPALIATLARTLNLLKTCRGADCTVKSFSVDAWQ